MWCVTKRLSVTLDAEDVRTVEQFADPSTREHESLVAWAASRGVDPDGLTSEAALLRLLLRAGAESLRGRVVDVAYADLAVTLADEASADSRAARARYVQRTEAKR
jgi:hypothetical protein